MRFWVRRSNWRSSSQRPTPSSNAAASRQATNGVRLGGCEAARIAVPRSSPSVRRRRRSDGRLRIGSDQNAVLNGVAVRSASRVWNSLRRWSESCAASWAASWPISCACFTCASTSACALSSLRRWALTSAASAGAPLAGAGPSTASCACTLCTCGARLAASWLAWSCTASACVRRSPSWPAVGWAASAFLMSSSCPRNWSICCDGVGGGASGAASWRARAAVLPKASRRTSRRRARRGIRA